MGFVIFLASLLKIWDHCKFQTMVNGTLGDSQSHTGWWFGIFFYFPYIGNNNKLVGEPNYQPYIDHMDHCLVIWNYMG